MNLIKKINYDDEGNYGITYLWNGLDIDFDDYIRLENGLGLEEDINFEDDYENELVEYNYDESCECLDCLINRYTERIANLGVVCPHCVKEALEQMVGEMME